ncbi:Xaa-Pro aminopeptidase OS=Lysinibacillus sphaericus OX=1421 GN=LS41612_20790 PE=3 SV=1 [Lysinibacillus sphaericus]
MMPLWTDGRYYIQADKQLENSGIRLFRMIEFPGASYTEWLAEVLEEGSNVGFDGNVFSIDMVRSMVKDLKAEGNLIQNESRFNW